MINKVLELDAAGFLPSPGETAEEFVNRAEAIRRCHRKFDEKLQECGSLVVFDSIEVSDKEKIDPELITSAGNLTWDLYRFRSRHVPGFFLSRSIGLLWGGCLIGDPDLLFSVFLIRNAFRTREKWLFYRRTELFAHELCHSMRLDLKEPTLEEYFAYQTSPSALRRYLGNCFIRDIDAILFVLPALLLLAATTLRDFFLPQLPLFPFWILALIYPAFLLLRNAVSRRIVKKAAGILAHCGVKEITPILFRCTRQELIQLGKLSGAEAFETFYNTLAEKELRWAVIRERFIKSPPAPEVQAPADPGENTL